MINEIRIQNFQSHKDTKLELVSGVNVIVGKSDSGKTAILRALRWLVWNRPSGDAFRSNWGGETGVDIWIDQGKPHIRRYRDVRDTYILNNNKFKAFGTAVPEEIQTALNINEINFQQQLDMPFLLTATAGEVATHFNRIARLDTINESLQRVNKWTRTIEQDIKYKKDEIANKQEEVKEYDHLDKFEVEVEVLERLEQDRNKASKDKSELNELIKDTNNITEVLAAQEEFTKDEALVNRTLGHIHQKNTLEDGPLATMGKLLMDYYAILEEEESLQEHLLEAEPRVTELYNQLLERTELENNLTRLIGRIDHINSVVSDTKINKTELDTTEAKFHKLFPDVCPLCDGTGGKPKTK